MVRRYSMFMAVVVFGLCVALGASQQPEKDGKKDGKDPKPPVPKALPEPDTSKEDLRLVREGGLKGDGPDLLDYFRKRTFTPPDPKTINALVRQLGDEDFATREKAYTSLMALGASALAGLKQGDGDPDLEIRKRVAELKLRVETKAEPTLQAAAARLLAKYKLAGTAEVVLKFLPFATDAMVVDEMAKALGAVAVRDGKVEPLLVKALDDTVAVNRGAAGEALIRAKAKEEYVNVKKLLKDTDRLVRLRICMAMMSTGDREIVPVMVNLMGELSPGELWPIEEALLRLAGEKAPSVSLGTDEASRKVCKDAWAKWLGEHEKSLDMAKLIQDNIVLGYTMIVQQNNNIGAGRGAVGEIFELDTKKNVRWKFEVNTYPVDAQILGPDRVLVAEYQGNRVTERNTKGGILWDYNCGGNPFTVQRLPNGNTFIAMQGRLVEVDRNKNEVWAVQRPQHDIVRAKRLPSGEVAFITNQGANATFTRMEPKTQKINKTFQITQVSMLFGNFEVLPNGNIIVPHYNQHRVVEYDDTGKQVGQPIQNQQWPNSVVRLANGNTLVASQNIRQVHEYDTNRNQVWTYPAVGNVFVARKR